MNRRVGRSSERTGAENEAPNWHDMDRASRPGRSQPSRGFDMSDENSEQAWVFYFFLEAQDGRLLAPSTAEDLLDQIISWVEEKGLQVGGGFRPPTYEEANPKP